MQTTQQKNHNNVVCLRAREHSLAHHVYVHIKEHNHRSYVADSERERERLGHRPTFRKTYHSILMQLPIYNRFPLFAYNILTTITEILYSACYCHQQTYIN